MGIHRASCPMFPVLSFTGNECENDGWWWRSCWTTGLCEFYVSFPVCHSACPPSEEFSDGGQEFSSRDLFKVVWSCWLIKLLVVHVVGDMGSQGLLKSQRITCGPCLPDSVYLHSVYYKYGNGARSVISTSTVTRPPPEYAQRQWLPPCLDVSSASPRW